MTLKDRGRYMPIFLCSLLFFIFYNIFPVNVFAQDDLLILIERKQKELTEREEGLKKEEERINAIKKDVEERIEKYTRLLNQLEEVLKKIERINEEKLDSLVKAYEAMTVEDASARLSALDEQTAVNILYRMKSKRVGQIIGQMDPKKAASITERMSRFVKNFPTK